MSEKPPARKLGKTLFKVQDSPRFPAELWQHFRDVAKQRGESWIDALRRAVEHYISQEPRS